MRIIRYGDGTKWGDKNARWGSPSYVLQPGDPGYVGPTPARRRQPSPSVIAVNPYPDTAMSFQYVILPNPQNTDRPFRARARLGAQVEQNELLDAIAADAAVDRATVEKVIRSLFKVMIGFLRQTRPIGYVLGLFRAFPSITGSFATNEPSGDEIKGGVGFTLAPGPDADALMSVDLAVEKVDEQGTVAPEIDSVTLSPGGQSGHYSTTAAMKVSGDHFRGSGQGQPWATARLLDASMANPIALPVFACSQTELLIGPAPAGTTGTRHLQITAGWDTTLSDMSEPLTPL